MLIMCFSSNVYYFGQRRFVWKLFFEFFFLNLFCLDFLCCWNYCFFLKCFTRWKVEGGSGNVAGGSWQEAHGGWQVAGGKWKVAGGIVLKSQDYPGFGLKTKSLIFLLFLFRVLHFIN